MFVYVDAVASWRVLSCAGDVGAMGSSGPAGPEGDIGATGLPGVAGDMGNTGPSGQPGPAGFTGPAGVTGNAGATGPSGPAGINYYVFITSCTINEGLSINKLQTASINQSLNQSVSQPNFFIAHKETHRQADNKSIYTLQCKNCVMHIWVEKLRTKRNSKKLETSNWVHPVGRKK